MITNQTTTMEYPLLEVLNLATIKDALKQAIPCNEIQICHVRAESVADGLMIEVKVKVK